MYISLKWAIELSQESNDDGEWKSNWDQVRAQRMAKRYDQSLLSKEEERMKEGE